MPCRVSAFRSEIKNGWKVVRCLRQGVVGDRAGILRRNEEGGVWVRGGVAWLLELAGRGAVASGCTIVHGDKFGWAFWQMAVLDCVR